MVMLIKNGFLDTIQSQSIGCAVTIM